MLELIVRFSFFRRNSFSPTDKCPIIHFCARFSPSSVCMFYLSFCCRVYDDRFTNSCLYWADNRHKNGSSTEENNRQPDQGNIDNEEKTDMHALHE